MERAFVGWRAVHEVKEARRQELQAAATAEAYHESHAATQAFQGLLHVLEEVCGRCGVGARGFFGCGCQNKQLLGSLGWKGGGCGLSINGETVQGLGPSVASDSQLSAQVQVFSDACRHRDAQRSCSSWKRLLGCTPVSWWAWARWTASVGGTAAPHCLRVWV